MLLQNKTVPFFETQYRHFITMDRCQRIFYAPYHDSDCVWICGRL